jgi:hypothetical protein
LIEVTFVMVFTYNLVLASMRTSIRKGACMSTIRLLRLALVLLTNIAVMAQDERTAMVLPPSPTSDLQPGATLTYHLRIDQHVMNGRGVAIPAIFRITVLDRDTKGTLRVATEVRSARELLRTDTLLMTSPRQITIVGVRSNLDLTRYEVTVDRFGREVTGIEPDNGITTVVPSETSLSRVTDSEAMEGILQTFPTEYALLAPYTPTDGDVFIGQVYVDTLYVRSMVQPYGRTTSATVSGSPTRPTNDTIIRFIRVDSTRGSGKDVMALMTVRIERHPYAGIHRTATAKMARLHMRGYMESFTTICKKIDDDKETIDYIGTSHLDSVEVPNEPPTGP